MTEDKAPGIVAVPFDELDAALAGPACDADAIWIELGSRRHLGAGDIVRASEALHTAIGKLTERQTLILTIGGYDQDPRELWEVPEAVKFLRRVMQHAGITHWSHPAVRMLNEASLALLIMCGVFGADHPFRVNLVQEDTSTFSRFHGGGR